MSFLPVYSLSEFEKAVIVRLEDDELRYKYQRMAGLVARNVRERFPPVPDKKSNAEEKVVHFPEWLNPISSFLGSYDKERFNSERTNFNANTIHTMANKSTLVNSVGYALLLHYRLHMSTKTADLEDAARLDRVVFGGKTFEEAVGDPVFVHEPDHYEEPPPMSAPMAHPQYLTAKEGRELLEKNPAHSGWLSPHNHYTIPLEGRKAEFKRLTKFAEGDEAPFRVLPIIAPSGAGKTRLVSEWMRRYSAVTNPETEWEAGFLTSENQDNARDPEPWKEWEIVKHTLIVIDYTYAFDEVVQAIAARAIKRPAGPRFKVRLIVIDHVMPTLLRDDFFWGKVAGGKRASLDLFEARYLEKELVLKSEQDDSSMLRKIIAAAGSVGQEFSLKEGDPLVTEAMEQLDRMGHEQGERDTVRHPLFAALLGRALRNTAGTVDFSKWTRRDLVEQYFTGEDRLPWGDGHSNTGGSDRTERGLYVGALVSAATLMRGLDQLVAKDIIPSSTREAFQIAQRVVSSASPHRIEPFLPDILGETFVLKFLEATEDSPEVFAKFIALLSMEDENPIEQARNFRETIARLARNLSGDNPNLDEVKENWRRLVEFLNPSRFRSDSTLQVFISYAAVDTMEMLHSVDNEQTENSNPTELNRYYALLRSKLEMQIMINHVYAENSAEDLMGWAKTAFCLYEKSSPSGREAQQQALANVARVFAARNAHEWTGTILASFFGRLIAVDFFLKELRENVNTAGVAGDTALMTASLNGHDAIVARLIEAGADVNQARTNDGTTALMMASQNGHDNVVTRLIEAGADVKAGGGNAWTALMAASQNGHDAIVARLIEAGVDVNQGWTDEGITALMAASHIGHDAIVACLIEAGADVNQARTNNGITALMTASLNGHGVVVTRLIEAGADVNHAGIENGWTALMAASQNGHDVVVMHLIEAGARVSQAGSDDGWTALMAASHIGHDAIVARLIEAGADVNQARTNDGTTALMMASQNGHEAIAARLIKAGALVSQPGKDDYATGCKSCFRFWKRQLRLVSAGCWRRTKR